MSRRSANRNTTAASQLRKSCIALRGERCECCGWRPIVLGNDRPSVQVHHLIPQAAGGPDTLENAILLCPGCHTTAHGLWGVYRPGQPYKGPTNFRELIRVLRVINSQRVHYAEDPNELARQVLAILKGSP